MIGKNSESSAKHKAAAVAQGIVPLAVVTVSDSRTPETDTNYHYLRTQIENAGHRLAAYRIVKDEPAQILAALDELSAGMARLVLFNGGTGISRRDTTYDVLQNRLEKIIPGFGELFRMLSYDQVGSSAMFSRALAGVYHDVIVVSTPGSPAAVALAWEKLIAPEIQHLAWEVTR
jgi:molybdenum cofactor biosynthesis protein B